MVGHRTVLKKRLSRGIRKDLRVNTMKCQTFAISSIMSRLRMNYLCFLGGNSTWGRPMKCHKDCTRCAAIDGKPSFEPISVVTPSKQSSTIIQFTTRVGNYLIALGNGDVAAKAAAHRSLPDEEHTETTLLDAIKQLLDDDLLFGDRRPDVRMEKAVALLSCPLCVEKAKQNPEEFWAFLSIMHNSMCREDVKLTKLAVRYLDWIQLSTSAVFDNNVVAHRSDLLQFYPRAPNQQGFSTKATWSLFNEASRIKFDLALYEDKEEGKAEENDGSTESVNKLYI